MISKIGLFGGTFNPIHFGHLKMANAFCAQLNLEKLYFIPAGHPYHKPLDSNTTPQDRYNMVKLAIANEPRFDISDCEVMRIGDTYTVDTLLAFREQMGGNGEIWWLLGSDSLLTLHEWFRFEEIFQLANLAIVPRIGFNQRLLDPKIIHYLGQGLNINLEAPVNHGKIQLLDMLPYDISSSQVRALVQTGQPVDRCVPKVVQAYIQEHELYI